MKVFEKIINWLTSCVGRDYENEDTDDFMALKEEHENRVRSGKLFLLTPAMLSCGPVCVSKSQN